MSTSDLPPPTTDGAALPPPGPRPTAPRLSPLEVRHDAPVPGPAPRDGAWAAPPVQAEPPVQGASRSAGPWLRRAARPLLSWRTYTETLYQLLNLPIGIALFTGFVVLLSVSAGLAITLVGIPLLLLTIAAGRIVGILERGRARLLLGANYRGKPWPRMQGSWWQKFKTAISDLPGWGGIGYGLLMLPWGIATFVSTVVLWSVGIGGISSPIWVWSSDIQIDGTDVNGGWRALLMVGAVVGGALVLLATPWVIRGIATADRWLVRTLLAQTRAEELETRVSELKQSRDASVDSAAHELRRIERDLHDGAQQRLVALAMDLGLARERLASGADPERAAELVARAHDEAKQAITELRDLVRGIHPSVLTDRGLDAALSALAARSPVPVDVQVELPERPSAPIEAAAYFVVAEALTNVAKHSGATAAWVRVTDRPATPDSPHRIVVEIRDDGRGGAEVHAGGGLAGLRDRVLAVEGRLRIASPAGGPTMLVAELPCGS
jgi:signal transduction histidine kinase